MSTSDQSASQQHDRTRRVIVGIGLGAVYGAAFAYVRALAKPGKIAAAMGYFTAILMITTLILTFVGSL